MQPQSPPPSDPKTPSKSNNNNLIPNFNSYHPSPSRNIYSDRFIPSRTSSNFALFGLSPRSQSGNKEDSNNAYQSILRNALFPVTPEKNVSGGSRRNLKRPHCNIFRYKTETNQPLHSLTSPFGVDDDDEELRGVSSTPIKVARKVSRSPYKVLDAPALQDDFYLNLVDWSSQNVLAVGLESCVYLWHASSGKVVKLCDLGIDDNVCSVGWAQRGTHLAVGTSNGKVQLWDASQSKRIRTMEGHRLRVGALAWSSSQLSSGSRDKSILQRDIRVQADYVSKLSGHKSEVCGLKWSPDSRDLASGGNDNRLFVWNNHSTQPVLKYCEHMAAVKAIAWSPHLHGLLASGGGTADRCIRFWNTTTNTHLSSIDTGSQVCNLVWSKNANELVSTHGYSQNQIILWKYPTMSKIATLTGHTYRVLYLAISPDGQMIVTGAGDETLRFWNVFPSPRSQNTESPIGASSLGRTQIR
ncbi:Fizzy-related protein -like protein [Capsicum annuum]|uniref:protein FIZZY-RELATED 2 n=1 Tax=Capsicum annuum TaxID=4072 RepID=UPI0007BFE22E|nr:protein FIZZY-RELATED 2 [Capsicum annuum]KAF3656043.1 Fizzy-related protein -like protein [Capsicum annuum]